MRNWSLIGLFAAGALMAAGNFIFPYLAARNGLTLWVAAIAMPAAAALFATGRQAPPRSVSLNAVLALSLLVPLCVELLAETTWPNSADEYGYVFLARTLLHGRLWNTVSPVPLIFNFAWIFEKGGKWFSQYPPAWSALLAPFVAARIAWLLNPLLTLLLALLSAKAMRQMRVPPGVTAPALFLLMLAPFTNFQGASLFAHTFTAVLITAILCLQNADEDAASIPARLGIGALFGCLLLTRYDVFLLTASCFCADRLWYRRWRFIPDALAMGAGGAPFIAIYLLYNHAITGHFLKTPYAWASNGAHIGLWGKHVVFRNAFADAVLRTLHWSGEFVLFTSPLLLFLLAAACIAQCRARTLRYIHIMLPVAIIFFFFYPNTGGHEFGPRYWFFAWPPAMIGMAATLAENDRFLRLRQWRFNATSLAWAHGALYLGVTIGIAAFTRIYVDARRAVYLATPPQTPALILIPSRDLMLTPLQTIPIRAHADDFTRNGVDLNGKILYARADIAGMAQHALQVLACSMTARHIYVWREPGVLVPLDCDKV